MELHRIYTTISQRSDAAALHQKIAEQAQKYRQTQAQYTNKYTGQLAWKKKGEDCVFLKDKSCSIYSVRPLACRSFFALTPAAMCNPQHPQYEQAKNPQFVAAQEFHQIILDLSAKLGLSLPEDLLCGLDKIIKAKSQIDSSCNKQETT